MSLNRVLITGRLTRDVEIKQINPNLTVGKMTVAVDGYNKKDAPGQKEVAFIDCTTWNNLAIHCSGNIRKGSLVLVEGRLKQEKWIDKETAKERSKLIVNAEQVLFLDKKEDPNKVPSELDPQTFIKNVANQEQNIDWVSDNLPF